MNGSDDSTPVVPGSNADYKEAFDALLTWLADELDAMTRTVKAVRSAARLDGGKP
jgi:hypothetical protein